MEMEQEPAVKDINLVEDFQIDHAREDVGCLHESFTPQDYVPIERKNPPAKTYPFKLDPFQVEAVKVLEKNESVLVAAHTSAGKTAIAEYSIAMAKRDG